MAIYEIEVFFYVVSGRKYFMLLKYNTLRRMLPVECLSILTDKADKYAQKQDYSLLNGSILHQDLQRETKIRNTTRPGSRPNRTG